MSGSLHQIRILRTAFKIGFVSVNIRLLHDSRIRFQNYRNYKNPIKSGYDGRQKKKILEEGGARNLLTIFEFQPLQNIFKDRSRIVICYTQKSI